MNETVHALTAWDPDGSGPGPAHLVTGGQFVAAGEVVVNYIARWDDSEWSTLGSGIGTSWLSTVLALTMHDPDDFGPVRSGVIAGGIFATACGVTVNNIAYWDGSQWLPLGSGMNGAVSALATWDPDGDGPLTAQLVAGGQFTTAGGVTVSYIARWDGSDWHPLGSGMQFVVRALTTWDPDGEGPEPAQLVAGGEFATAGGATVNNIAYWDGLEWRSFGSGTNGTVHSLTTWDPDGAGPQHPQLIAGGNFTTAGGVTVNRIARWDGSSWQPLGSGVSAQVRGLTIWDRDGDGPEPARLVAGGHFATAGGVVVNYVACWDGSSWLALGSGMGDWVTALTTWDPDGEGHEPDRLVVGGIFITAAGEMANRIMFWDGSKWRPFVSGMNGAVRAISTWDHDGDEQQPHQLVAGGSFTSAAGLSAGFIAMWSTLAPDITTQPLGDSVSTGAAPTLTVTARNGQPTYQWRRDAEPLSNGPTGSGSIISGTSTATLTIANAQPGDSGDYDCIVTNSCGEVVSEVAVVVVAPPPSCGGDANGDDVVNGADLSVLLFLFGQSVTPGTAADFNGDGVVDGADLSVLLFRFGASC